MKATMLCCCAPSSSSPVVGSLQYALLARTRQRGNEAAYTCMVLVLDSRCSRIFKSKSTYHKNLGGIPRKSILDCWIFPWYPSIWPTRPMKYLLIMLPNRSLLGINVSWYYHLVLLLHHDNDKAAIMQGVPMKLNVMIHPSFLPLPPSHISATPHTFCFFGIIIFISI